MNVAVFTLLHVSAYNRKRLQNSRRSFRKGKKAFLSMDEKQTEKEEERRRKKQKQQQKKRSFVSVFLVAKQMDLNLLRIAGRFRNNQNG
jgi:hypothetical protein